MVINIRKHAKLAGILKKMIPLLVALTILVYNNLICQWLTDLVGGLYDQNVLILFDVEVK